MLLAAECGEAFQLDLAEFSWVYIGLQSLLLFIACLFLSFFSGAMVS